MHWGFLNFELFEGYWTCVNYYPWEDGGAIAFKKFSVSDTIEAP